MKPRRLAKGIDRTTPAPGEQQIGPSKQAECGALEAAINKPLDS